MACEGPLLMTSAVEAVRADVGEMARGLDLVARSLLAAVGRCAAMEAGLDERQRRLDERWRRMEEKALAIEASLAERWCGESGSSDSPEVRLTALEESVSRTLQVVFPRVEALLSHMNVAPSPAPRYNTASTSAPKITSTSSLSTATKGSGHPAPSSSSFVPSPLPSTSAAGPSGSPKVTPEQSDKDIALRNAANLGQCSEMLKLIRNGANVNSANKNGRTPLHCASLRGCTKSMNILFLNGACVNLTDKNQVTPLHCAAMNAHEDAVRELLAAGADTFLKDSSGETPLDVAITDSVRELLRTPPLHLNPRITNQKIPKTAATSPSATASPSNNEGRERLLRSSANSGCCDEVHSLLRKGADPNAINGNGRTALHLAALNGHPESVRHLLRFSADVNARDFEARTPLHYAARNRHKDVVDILLKAGANADARDGDGQRPQDLGGAHIAAIFENYFESSSESSSDDDYAY